MGISSVFIDVGKEAVAQYTPCSIREMELWHSITAAETERELYSTVLYSAPGSRLTIPLKSWMNGVGVGGTDMAGTRTRTCMGITSTGWTYSASSTVQ